MPATHRPFSPYLMAALLGYLAFICYGSLYPFHAWHTPHGEWWSFLFAPAPRFMTRTDLITNVLVYLPFGMLVSALLAPRMRTRGSIWWAVLAGLTVSLLMELLQLFIPNRVSSNIDIASNALGTLLGSLLFRVTQHGRWPGRILFHWRDRWFLPGAGTNAGLVLLALWMLSQLSLELPSLLAGSLHTGFTPWWEALPDLSRFHPERAVIYALEIVSLGLFARTLLRPDHKMLAVILGVLVGVMAAKFLAAAALVKLSVLSRLLSLEVLSGLVVGLAILLMLLHRKAPQTPYGMAILFLLALAATRGWWVPVPVTPVTANTATAERLFNITGLTALTSTLWPYLAAIFVALSGWRNRERLANVDVASQMR